MTTTPRNPALTKLDSLYFMATGKELPPLPPGDRKSVINSTDGAGDLGVGTKATEPTDEPITSSVSEGIRHWIDVCENVQFSGRTSGSTNQRGRGTTGSSGSSARPNPPTRPTAPPTRPTAPPTRPTTRTTTARPPRRRFQVVIPSSVSAGKRAIIERNLQTVQSKLASEGLGQLLTAAKMTFCVIPDNQTAGLFYFTDRIEIDLRLPPFERVIFHELGHRFHLRKREVITREGEIDRQIRGWYALGMSDSRYMPTAYARTNHMEFWAECFAHYMLGILRNEQLRAWVKATIVAFRIVTGR